MKQAFPSELPVIALRHPVILPAMILPMFVGEDRERLAMEAARLCGGYLLLTGCWDGAAELHGKDASAAGPPPFGCVALLLRSTELEDGRLKVLVQGIAKARILEITKTEPHRRARIEPVVEEEPPVDQELVQLMEQVRHAARRLFLIRGISSGDAGAILEGVRSPGRLADLIAMNLDPEGGVCREFTAPGDPVRRLHQVHELLRRELDRMEVRVEIELEAENALRRRHKERYLREQLRAIRRELGEWNEEGDAVLLREKIDEAGMPEAARREAIRQLQRLEQMPPDAAESAVVRTYLDWLTEMPWNKVTPDRLDLKEASRVLDEDHYDMERVKERILDFLGVCKLKRSVRGPILCLVGPPGVGKTSLGRSIARAMGRRFVRMSLGGIRDEAEIRGHRRTYLGALPGRIIEGIRNAGTRNPVFMLDEIDKVGRDFRGDPAAALLEVLDPEQNRNFSDHYLNVAFDLSSVLFITTANAADSIPAALLDRLEVIHLTGYTEREKIVIAEKFLLPRQLSAHGLSREVLAVHSRTLAEIVRRYTQESGVRQLEREIASLCRKVARRMAEGASPPFRVTRRALKGYLGPPPFAESEVRKDNPPGVALGLAWTPHGGEVLTVEASVMPGKGELILTGHMGEVMKESARAALSYVRSRSESLAIPSDFYTNQDVHLHVPAGAIPKDGPSAGLAMAVALVSALSQRPVRAGVAMTGEISLLGDVLPVGGLKEKVLAALRHQIREVIVPAGNEADVRELPAYLKRRLKAIPVQHLGQVFGSVLGSTISGERGDV
ncbi:endopeptidase La [Desulfoglaeba alkanexedens]|uniref:Lon protease n=1 Tax=Desulfoglaeba alkanexedens ALDC TaxID=980445 RepID=A0A4P8L1P9_9BACT|nr:endopeptidase La [Desulfoglaeba alkanexedens]QCQ21796.1 endopeptidase La [Desulfoglaeba alkanexedens ALDC]